MNKKIIAAAVITACSSFAQAQSNVTVYGDIDQYVGYISSSSGNHVIGMNDGAILRSRLGFKGAEELGNPRVEGTQVVGTRPIAAPKRLGR